MKLRQHPEKQNLLSNDVRAERAQQILAKILHDPHIDIWPRKKIRRKKRSSEKARAQSLQTYTKVIGGAAIFAYVYSNREKLRFWDRKQSREFEAGVVSPDQRLFTLSGKMLAERVRTGLFKHETRYHPEFDPTSFETADLEMLEDTLESER